MLFRSETILSFDSGGRFKEPLAFIDMDNDGNTEYMSFNDDRLYVWRDDGSLILNYNSTNGIDDAKIFFPDCTISWWQYWYSTNPTCIVTGKIAIAETSNALVVGTTYNFNNRILVLKLDGSTLWDKTYTLQETPIYDVGLQKSRLAITDDYDGDNKNDIFVSFMTHRLLNSLYQNSILLLIRKGTNGDLLNDTKKNIGITGVNNNFDSLTIGDIDYDGYDDFLGSNYNGYIVYSPKKAIQYIFDNSSIKAKIGRASCRERV